MDTLIYPALFLSVFLVNNFLHSGEDLSPMIQRKEWLPLRDTTEQQYFYSVLRIYEAPRDYIYKAQVLIGGTCLKSESEDA